jgi:hypothetical protein
MKRRESFAVLGLAGIGSILPELAAAPEAGGLNDEQVAALLRHVAGVEPRPGEAARVREALAGTKATAETDPRVQPALGFDPEVEP